VDVRREGRHAVFRVRDTGIGIAPDMLPRVFELFTQAEQGAARSAGGLGIGLTLARGLVEMHGGTIVAASEGPERGAQFTVRLPVEVEVAAPLPVPAAAPSPDRSRTILIVEDNDDARESLRLLLESLGHRVLEARDGLEGLALAAKHPLDIALIDLGLPGPDGYEVAQTLRSRLGTEALLIAVTGYGQAEDRRRSKEAGFDAHLVKPVSQALLLPFVHGPRQ
jgi:two-component system CheB/CheR fusion protein